MSSVSSQRIIGHRSRFSIIQVEVGLSVNILIEEMESTPNPSTSCTSLQKISYGLGHVYNDLCAAMWFSYTLFYLQVVLEVDSKTAGTFIMVGQVVDSLATPAAGWAIDYFGGRRLWHFGGTIAVSIGFGLIFSLKPTTLTVWVLVYYGAVIALFQIGWAVVQISHLSIIPQISRSHRHSSDLTTIRYSASVCCSVSVYLITLMIFKNNGESNVIGPGDFFKFKEIALIIMFIGILSSLFFYCGILGVSEETPYACIPEEETEDANNLNAKNISKHFLRSSIIYFVSVMYMASRLFTTLNLIYIPLYLDERQTIENGTNSNIRQMIASVPLVSYLASFLTSIFLKFRIKICQDKIVYMTGSLIGLCACIWISIGISTSSDAQIYIIALLLGFSGSSTMVASLCLTANFVKVNGYGGGSVYSVVTFTDKLISGGVVLLVQNLQCTPRSLCPNYYEHVLSYICGTVSITGLVALGSLKFQIRRNGSNE